MAVVTLQARAADGSPIIRAIEIGGPDAQGDFDLQIISPVDNGMVVLTLWADKKSMLDLAIALIVHAGP